MTSNSEYIFKEDFEKIILQKIPILDVRSEIEFQQGHIPFSTNIPILLNDERAQVGTIYKKHGHQAALELGHQLVSADNRTLKIKKWMTFLKSHPQAVLTCFRGGLRSQIAQQWLGEAGHTVPRIHGGTKAFRQFLNHVLNLDFFPEAIVISGPTGSGKSYILEQLESLQKSVLHLEQLAAHKGSAFGGRKELQPSQTNFENTIASFLIRNKMAPFFFLEDESRMIGQLSIPEKVFQMIRQSPIVLVEENIDDRAWEIYRTYILETSIGERNLDSGMQLYNYYRQALLKISNKLGGLKYSEILFLLESAETEFRNDKDLRLNFFWIKELLQCYYDPLYKKSLLRRTPQIRFAGRKIDVEQFCRNL